jgi:drug/metabolite transporter (DMT)-like permease/prolyl-tRNA editing enzyme YbaK/EbsC (Cys-tRNA(Pro) deacylase)
MVLASGALFAINGTVSKLVLKAGVSAAQLATIRATGAFAGLLVVALTLRPRHLRLARRDLSIIAAYGLSGFFFVPLLYFVAIARLSVGIALLFEYTAPLFVALWVRLVQRRPVRRRLWLGLALSLTGLACVAEVWGDLRLDPLGVLAGLGAAVLLAAYFLFGAHGTGQRDALSLTCWAFGCAAIAGAIITPWWRLPTAILASRSAGWPVWLLCAWVVVLGSILPYLLVTGALGHLPTTSVSILAMVEPVIAAAMAWLVLHEQLPAIQIAGGALVLTGVVLAETARAGSMPLPTTPEVPPPTGARSSKMDGMHPNVRAVQDALDNAGARAALNRPSQVIVLPDAVHTAPAAAAALGVQVGQIANSLVFDADGEPLLALVSGAHRADLAKLATLMPAERINKAAPDFVKQHTGQVIGGVAPLGHRKPIRTLVDTALAQYEEIWAAGGVPQAVFPITYAELVRVTAGTPADLA